jgi:hypothetical protein
MYAALLEAKERDAPEVELNRLREELAQQSASLVTMGDIDGVEGRMLEMRPIKHTLAQEQAEQARRRAAADDAPVATNSGTAS